MPQIIAAYQNEMEKLFKQKKIYFFMIVNIVICSIYVLTIKLLNLTQLNLSSGNMIINLLNLYVNIIIPIFLIMETMELFSAEFTSGTIKNILIQPITRFKIYISKIMALTTFIAINLLFIFVFSAIFNREYTVSLHKTVLAYIVSIYPLLIFSIFTSLISQFLKNGLLGMLLCILLFLFTKGAKLFYVTASAFLFTSYLDWYKMFIMTNINWLYLLSTFIFLASYGVIMFLVGYKVFNGKEF